MLFSSIKSDTVPDTLSNLSLECICNNLHQVFLQSDHGYEIEDDMVLPKEICEALIEVYQRVGKTVDDEFLHLFGDRRKTVLQKVTIWNSTITDLKNVLQYNLRELDLAYCKDLNRKSFGLLNEYGKNLKSLSLGSEVNLMNNLADEYSRHKMKTDICPDLSYNFSMPNLTRLILRDIAQQLESSFYQSLLASLPKLTHLDISNCSDLGDLSYIANSTNLTSLTLFNCNSVLKAIPHICQLSKLR